MWRALALVLVLATCGIGCAGNKPQPQTGPQRAAVRLLEVGIGEADPDVIRPLIGESYRQHNPRVADGPSGLLDFVTEFSRLPPERRVAIRVLRIFEDGEFVVTHSEYKRRGMRISGMDVFRVRDGKLVEHWDAGMRERALNASGHGLLDGDLPDHPPSGNTEATRSRIKGFIEQGLVARNSEELKSAIAEDCTQHDPRFGDGRQAWLDSLAGGVLVHERLERTIADGNWALTQSEGRLEGDPAVIYDLFRLEAGKVAEHWVVWERIPKRMRHSNGML